VRKRKQKRTAACDEEDDQFFLEETLIRLFSLGRPPLRVHGGDWVGPAYGCGPLHGLEKAGRVVRTDEASKLSRAVEHTFGRKSGTISDEARRW
jgi:hypothetical protein